MPKRANGRNLLKVWMVCAGLVLGCSPAADTKPLDDEPGSDSGQVPDPMDGGSNPSDSGFPEARGRVTGRVFDQRTLRPIAGVQVHTPAGQIAVTDAQGAFSAEVDTLGETGLTFHALGYARGIEPTSIAENEVTYLEAQLLPVDAMAMVSSDKGGAVNGTAGAAVEFGANAFKHKDGTPVKGDVIVELTALDPSTPEGLRAFPGSFAATSKDGKPGQLITVVPMDITARQGDKVLDIAADTKAVVHFPIANPETAPATIALWSLSETTGEWVEEGVAEKIFDAASRSYVYRGSIQHMSWWNCDSFARITCIRGCVKTSDGTPVPQARTLAEGIDFSNIGEGYTGPNGCFAEDVPAGGQLRVKIQSSLGVSEARVVTAENTERRARENPGACQDLGTFTIDTMPMMEGCPAGLSECGESCVDLGSSAANCGACGTACEDGASCVGGQCSCKASELSCDGVCTNVRDSSKDCGACGNACGKGAECVEGSCVQVACPAGTVQCLGGCFNGETCCGDAACDASAGEDAQTCNADCGKPSVCGDATCGGGETVVSCAADCSVCGDKICSGSETVASCATDCFLCGDGVCTGAETHQACPSDCACDGFACGDGECIQKLKAACDGTDDCANGFDEDNCATTECGNGVCDAGESAASCPADCDAGGGSDDCGDGICSDVESPASCPADCTSGCGDGSCDGSETPASCPLDCAGSCGDGTCAGGETTQTCQVDCSRCGDDYCSPTEQSNYDFFGECPEDCGSCGDSYCTWDEYGADSCSADCGVCGDDVCSEAEWAWRDCDVDCDYSGQGEIGDFCWTNDECITGLACRGEVCAELGQDGELCDNDDQDDEDCSTDLACVGGTCVQRAGLDELCFERNDCQAQLVCNGELCAEPAQVGESCVFKAQIEDSVCAVGLVCVARPDEQLGYIAKCEDPTVEGSPCNWDEHCSGDRTCFDEDTYFGTCRDRGTVGVTCFDANDCVSGLGCYNGQCVAGTQPGAPCDIEIDYSTDEEIWGADGDDTDCADGLVCVWFRDAQSASCAVLGQLEAACGEYADCVDPLHCVYGTASQGTCSAAGELGDVCDFAENCVSGLVCLHEGTGGTCEEPSAVGEACDDENDCVDGLACMAHQCVERSATGGTCEMQPWHPWWNADVQYEGTYPRSGSGDGSGSDGGSGSGGGSVPGTGQVQTDGSGEEVLYGDHSDCVDTNECWEGTCVAPGELGYSCYEDAECVGGIICRDQHCQALGELGDVCDWQEDTDCAQDLGCDDGLCATAGGLYASCDPSAPCDVGLVCRDDRCGAPAQLGEACEEWWWTPSGYNTGCADGLACVQSVCIEAGSLGTPCDTSGDCLNGLVCGMYDECVLPSTEGEDCWVAPCAEGLVCEQYSQTCVAPAQLGASCQWVPCDTGLACDYETQVCMLAAFEGDACTPESNAACVEGFECLDGSCVQDGSLGTSCYGSINDSCQSGLTCGYDDTCRVAPGFGDSCAEAPCTDGSACNQQSLTCVAPASLGEDCSYVDCVSDLTCAWDDVAETNLCRPKAQEGESCEQVECADGLSCEFSEAVQGLVCVPSAFACNDGSWIPLHWQCDGWSDCEAGEDELGCTYPEFTCNDGSTIPLDWKCDGGEDCLTGEDELGCTYPEFTCNDGSTIPLDWKCDGGEDCLDGEDELGCSGQPEEFTCADGVTTIPAQARCDTVNDCAEGEDEVGCLSDGGP